MNDCPIPPQVQERLRALDPYRWQLFDEYAAQGCLAWAADEGRKPHVLKIRGQLAAEAPLPKPANHQLRPMGAVLTPPPVPAAPPRVPLARPLETCADCGRTVSVPIVRAGVKRCMRCYSLITEREHAARLEA